jgi:hypothetical protein
MSIFVTSDPTVEPICIRVERILPGIGKSAGVKDAELFRALMLEFVERAHCMARSDPTSLKGTKRIGQLVYELQAALDDNRDVAEYLDWRGDLEAVSDLAERLYELERLKRDGRPNKWAEIIRKRFVNSLLDAAYEAGGDLGVNRRNGRGSLVDAVNLLKPHLPKLFRRGLSPSTLKTIKTAWLKTRKK